MKSIGARLVAAFSQGRKGKRAKYGNTRIQSEDGQFDSKAEYRRWCDLKLLERAGKIHDLKRQVRYTLCVQSMGEEGQGSEITIGQYVADFVYILNDGELGKQVVEDVKGHRTQLFIWKKKHMKAQYGIEIVEVKA